MVSIIWDINGIIYIVFCPMASGINEYYSHILLKFHIVRKKIWSCLITNSVLFLQNNARIHTARCIICMLQNLARRYCHTSYILVYKTPCSKRFLPVLMIKEAWEASISVVMTWRVQSWLQYEIAFYVDNIQALVKLLDKCINIAKYYTRNKYICHSCNICSVSICKN